MLSFMELLEYINSDMLNCVKELIDFANTQCKNYKSKKSLQLDCLILACFIEDVKEEYKNKKGKKELLGCIRKVSQENGIKDWIDLIQASNKINKYVEAFKKKEYFLDTETRNYILEIEELIQGIISENPRAIQEEIEKREISEELLKKIKTKRIDKVIRSHETSKIKKEFNYSDTLNLWESFQGLNKSDIFKNQNKIKKQIEEFIDSFRNNYVDLYMELQYSLAYFIGRTIYNKSISDISPWQPVKSKNNKWFDWSISKKSDIKIEPRGCGYKYDNGVLNVIISFLSNHNIENDVMKIQKLDNSKDNIYVFDNSYKEVEDGDEAYAIADQITMYINNEVSKAGKDIMINLYIASPLTVAYYLGYSSYKLKNINIYEFEQNKDKPDEYILGLTL